jgi:antitoxin ParD1/3/4
MQNVERLSITLPIEMAKLIRSKVEQGGYASNSEVIREAMRLFARAGEREASARLRQAWDEGIASGDAGELDFADVKAEARRRLAAAK